MQSMNKLPRRTLILGTGLLALPALGSAPAAQHPGQALAALERRHGGRLGVALRQAGGPLIWAHRADERFALCSTFKLLLAAVVLRQVEQGRLDPQQFLRFQDSDWVAHAPVTRRHKAAGGMTALALAEATQTTSDNPAANALLRRLGGPAALQAEIRALGDSVTRIDRWEPAMNLVPPGEVRDTTSPAAMAATVGRVFGSDWLSPAARERLAAWTLATATGLDRLRAGLPADWRVGDKTGTGRHPSMPDQINDVAIIWRLGQAPFVLSAYYAAPRRKTADIPAEYLAVLAAVGRLAAQSLA